MDKNHEENLKKGRLLINHLEELQYSYFNGRPKWITIQKNDLKLFIACLYFEYPSPKNEIMGNNDGNDNNSEDIFKFYKKEIQKKILNMEKVLKEKFIEPSINNNIEVGITMVHSICKNKCQKLPNTCQDFPNKDIHSWKLIRLNAINNKCIFVDFLQNRTYDDWDQYLEKNDLPEGFMFYPISGFYDASKELHQTITPASKISEKVLKFGDKIADISCYSSGIILSCGLIFPLAVPIILVTAGTSILSASYTVYRQINRLVDMYRYNNQLGVECLKHWIELAIAAIGVIAAPFHTLAAISQEVNSVFMTTGKALTIFRRSTCITLCTLEVFRATLDFIDNNFEITSENVLKLRLDFFILTGVVMCPSYIKHVLKILARPTVWSPFYKTMEQIPYCLGKVVWNSVYFFKNHFAVFVEQVKMFLDENLTPKNLLLAWKMMRSVFDGYQKQTAELDVGALLWHVVNDIAEDESVKYVLRGQCMEKLLDRIRECAPKTPIHRGLIKYCVNRVLREAEKLSALYDDSVAKLASMGETRTWKVDEEFCAMFGLEKCSMDQYVLYAIGEIGKNAAALMAEYEEHASRPENMFDDEMVVSQSNDSGQSVKGYTLVAPCSVLDIKICLQLAEKINPQPHRYIDHQLLQPEPGVSLMIGVSAFNVNIVFFGVDLINGVPKLSICFFQNDCHSGLSITDHKGFDMLRKT